MTSKGIRRKIHGVVKRMGKASVVYNREKRNLSRLRKMLKQAEKDER